MTNNRSSVQILVGGPAGSGNITSGIVLARAFMYMGYYAVGVSEYPSLIRGGHTAYWVRAGTKKIYELEDHTDIVVAFDEATFQRHGWEIHEDSIAVYDPQVVKNVPENIKKTPIPFRKLLRENGLKPITMNMMAVGAVSALLGLPLDTVLKSVEYQFRGRERVIEENKKSCMIGYEYMSSQPLSIEPPRLDEPRPWGKRIMITGNEAIAVGFVKGDLRMYVAYPMTPASPLLHFMVRMIKEKDIVTIQAESEIAAAQMALAACWTGIRAATGTSGGGFALMNETLSEAGMFEAPLIIVVAMRPGPSTGMATHSAQEDLLYSIFAGHGEFPRIVVAPADQEDAYYRAVELLNLAWKWRVPGIILEDKHLAESIRTVPAFREDLVLEKGALLYKEEAEEKIRNGWKYLPYQVTENGVSPWVPTGTEGALNKSDSSEHDERGIVSERPHIANMMYKKRMRKEKYILEDLEKNYEVIRTYGYPVEEADTVVLTWGSATWASLEAKKHLDKEGLKLGIVQVIYLWPFPKNKFNEVMGKASGKPVFTVEYNLRGQLGLLAKMVTGFTVTDHIGKIDGRPFRGRQLAQEIISRLKR